MQVRWGDALQVLPQLKLPDGCDGIDVLLLDGVPKETLAYLRAAEPLLSDGAVVVADNAGAQRPTFLLPPPSPPFPSSCHSRFGRGSWHQESALANLSNQTFRAILSGLIAAICGSEMLLGARNQH